MNINRFDTLLGYEKTLLPMRAAKAKSTLEKKYRYSILDDNINEIKEIMTQAEYIVYAIQNGHELREDRETPCNKCQIFRCMGKSDCTKGKNKYYLWENKYGSEIPKTGYDFALWLISEGLISFDTVQKRINTEIAEKEKAQQEAEQAEQEQKSLAEAEKKAENEYKEWLYETAKNYGGINTPEGLKILIQHDIFMDICGQYNERVIEFLVMIDNIDNPRCRKDIISRLHNTNIGNIKTFEHITGIKLAKTHKERKIQLESIQKSDYADQPKQYKPRKSKNQAEYSDIFYKNQRSGEKRNIEFVESRGRLWQYNGYDFFITYTKKNKTTLYEITEGTTGILIAHGNTLKEVKDIAQEITHNMRDGKPLATPFATIIEKNIKEYGISPLYQEKSNLYG